LRGKTRVLDAGCGRGELMQMLAQEGYLVEGFDFDPVCVELGSKFGPCKQGDISKIDELYPPDYFDVVISLHVIEHTENPKACIEKFKLLTRQFILLAVPNLSSFPLLVIGQHIPRGNHGHLCGWNHSHFENLLTTFLHLEIIEWATDCVRLYDNLPYLGWLDNFFHRTGIRFVFEEKIFKKLFPYLSNSLIVLTKK
jgi:SAM-dependent methyltransferase